MAFQERLAQHDEAFNRATPRLGMGELPPDGTYHAVIDDFDFIDASSGLFLKTVLKIVGSDYEGQIVDTLHALDNPDRFDSLKTHLERMGVETTNLQLSQIEELLPRLMDVPVEIAVKTADKINEKTGQPYRNLYVQSRLGNPLREQTDVPADGEGLGQNPPAAGGSPDEDIPF